MLETTGRPFGGCGHQGGRRELKRGGILWDWFGGCIWLSLVNPGLEEGKVMKFREAVTDMSSSRDCGLASQAGCCSQSKLSSPTGSGHRPLVHSISHKVLCFLNIETNCRSVGGLIVLYCTASFHPVLKSSQELTQSKDASPGAVVLSLGGPVCKGLLWLLQNCGSQGSPHAHQIRITRGWGAQHQCCLKLPRVETHQLCSLPPRPPPWVDPHSASRMAFRDLSSTCKPLLVPQFRIRSNTCMSWPLLPCPSPSPQPPGFSHPLDPAESMSLYAPGLHSQPPSPL